MEGRDTQGAHGICHIRLLLPTQDIWPLCALFLLTSSAELWKRSANCFYRKGFEPAYAVLGGISPHDYALISAAKGLYRGVGGPATMELADPDIVDAEVFRMIVNATLIARYGLPVLDIRARRARV
ncbi:MAG: hypothetical protein ACLRIS_22010 [Flavonifractor plautii]